MDTSRQILPSQAAVIAFDDDMDLAPFLLDNLSSSQSGQVPLILAPGNILPKPRPYPLEPSAQGRDIGLTNGKLKVRPSTKPGPIQPLGLNAQNTEIQALPRYVNPADLGGNSNKRQKLDFFTLPIPTPVASQPVNVPPALPPILLGLHQPPPNAARFLPITETKSTQDDLLLAPLPIFESPVEVVDKDVSTERTKLKNGKTKRVYARERRPWTDEETRDLVEGVKIYGHGKWRKILRHDGYRFHPDRTAVDLKDRHRTYLMAIEKALKQKSKTTQTMSKDGDPIAAHMAIHPQLLASGLPDRLKIPSSAKPKPSTTAFEITTVESFKEMTKADSTADGPSKWTRWTSAEDDRLITGFRKYGPRWSKIAEDGDLNLATRTPPQLRDRFRVKWPEQYSGKPFPAESNEGSASMEEATNSGSLPPVVSASEEVVTGPGMLPDKMNEGNTPLQDPSAQLRVMDFPDWLLLDPDPLENNDAMVDETRNLGIYDLLNYDDDSWI